MTTPHAHSPLQKLPKLQPSLPSHSPCLAAVQPWRVPTYTNIRSAGGAVGGLVDHGDYFLVALVLAQVEPFEALEFIPGLHEFLLDFAEFLLLLAQHVFLLVDLPFQPFVAHLQIRALLQDLFDAALDFVHAFVDQSHVLLVALGLLDEFAEGGDLLVVAPLHLLDDAHEDFVALGGAALLLLDARLVEVVDVLQTLVQLHHAVHQDEGVRVAGTAQVRVRLRLVVPVLLPAVVLRLAAQLLDGSRTRQQWSRSQVVAVGLPVLRVVGCPVTAGGLLLDGFLTDGPHLATVLLVDFHELALHVQSINGHGDGEGGKGWVGAIMLEMNNVVERVVKEEEQKVLKKIKNYIYDHTAPIGKGFSSLVYSGHNEATNEVIAIKVIELAKIENAVQKYLLNNEINALRALSHPHVIRTVEILMTKHNVYIMTEFCENGDLQQHIKRNGKLSEFEALHITKDIVEGYIAIEEKQIVHRDMKTANIFLTATGARIADFGFCDFVNEAKKPPEFYNVGSPAYMSPEIYRENIYSSKSDIWGIGIILFEMLTGDTPDKNLTYFEMSSNLMNGKINSGPNEEIRKILAACFKKDLRERVSSIHLLDMVAKEIARLEGPAKLMVRPHTVGPHHNQSMPASNSKVQGLTHVHPLSPSEVNFRHSQRHMVSSALPLVDDSLRGQSPFKTRFGGIMNREDGREGRNLEPSPLKQGLEKRFTREDDSRAKREAAISLKIKNLTEMLLFLFRQLNFIGDINLERGNFARLILFRHRSYLEGLVEKVVSQERLDRNISEPLKGFHFLKSKFDQTYLQKEVQGNTNVGPSHILARLNQYANQPFSESRCLSTYCNLVLQATRECEQSAGKFGLSSDQISKIGVAWDYMLIHVEIMILYASGNTVDVISQDFIQLGNLLKEQPRKLGHTHMQLLKIKQKMIAEQCEQWISDSSREKREESAQGYRQLADLPERKALIQTGFF